MKNKNTEEKDPRVNAFVRSVKDCLENNCVMFSIKNYDRKNPYLCRENIESALFFRLKALVQECFIMPTLLFDTEKEDVEKLSKLDLIKRRVDPVFKKFGVSEYEIHHPCICKGRRKYRDHYYRLSTIFYGFGLVSSRVSFPLLSIPHRFRISKSQVDKAFAAAKDAGYNCTLASTINFFDKKDKPLYDNIDIYVSNYEHLSWDGQGLLYTGSSVSRRPYRDAKLVALANRVAAA